MEVHSTSIIRTFRGLAAASSWIPAFSNSLRQNQPTSAPVNPQITRLCFCPIIPKTFTFSSAATTTNSSGRWLKEARKLCSATGDGVVRGKNEYNGDESSRENAKYPRPQEVPWQRELADGVYLVGVIDEPVRFKYTQSGELFAWTTLAVKRQREETMWFLLKFCGELAETAVQHLKQNDKVCVSGFLALRGGEDNKLTFKVIANTLNFIQKTSLDFSQQVVVGKNTPSPDLSRQEVIYGDTFQYKKSPVQFSSSGKNAQKSGVNVESLWQTFFANPFEWWDNRTSKRNPKAPDFRHKDSGEALWIEHRYIPSWVKSQLDVLDSRFEKWGERGSSTRLRGSLSSFRDSDF